MHYYFKKFFEKFYILYDCSYRCTFEEFAKSPRLYIGDNFKLLIKEAKNDEYITKLYDIYQKNGIRKGGLILNFEFFVELSMLSNYTNELDIMLRNKKINNLIDELDRA